MVKSYRFEPEQDRSRRRLERHLDERRQLHPHGAGRRAGGPQGRARRQRLDRLRQARHLHVRLHAAQPGHGRRGDRQVIARAAVERDLVIVACAISAGIHAALIPDHLTEGMAAGRWFCDCGRSPRRSRRRADAGCERGCPRCGRGSLRRAAPELRPRGDHRAASTASRPGSDRRARALHQVRRAGRSRRFDTSAQAKPPGTSIRPDPAGADDADRLLSARLPRLPLPTVTTSDATRVG